MSYYTSVILVSLALYGCWYVIKDVWTWVTALKFGGAPTSSFVILVHNMQYELEELLRYLVNAIAEGGCECDVIVVDCGSDDLTPTILRRLAAEMSAVTVVTAAWSARPVDEVLPLCRGAVVHVLDLTGRLKSEQFMPVVAALLRQNQQEMAVRGKSSG